MATESTRKTRGSDNWVGKFYVIEFRKTTFILIQSLVESSQPFCSTRLAFPFVRSDQSVLKCNAQVLRTVNGQNGRARGSEPLSSPALVGQS